MNARRIAIFRALQLGDMLCMVPALRALRHAAPGAEITLIGLPWASAFAQRFAAYIDDFVAFPGIDGFPEQETQRSALPGFIDAMRHRRFDLVLQMHGSGELSNPLVASFGAASMAGFHPSATTPADPRSFLRWDERQNEVLRFLALLNKLGVPAQGEHLEFPLVEDDYLALRRSAPELAAAGEYACIHPGARLGSRRWPAARFAEIAGLLAAQGLQVVLTGSAQETGVTAAVRDAVDCELLDLTGCTTLGSLAALIADARLLVCNDTGVSHVAAAVATPSVVVCSGADPGRWSPLATQRHRVLWADAPCRPCMHVDCPYDGHPCASAVTVEEVWGAANAVLEGAPRARAAHVAMGN